MSNQAKRNYIGFDRSKFETLVSQRINIETVDLKSPPGFVGELATWIEANSRRPRQHLSVASAIMAVANLVGLRYTDDIDGVTTNLFIFCIAGSATGKETQLQCLHEILRVAGIERAAHGSIKSEQEIVRNMVRNQACFFIIDEIGFLLKKIKNAQKTGNSSYLEGIVGCLMAAFSKANKFYLINGDIKDEINKDLRKKLRQLENQESKNSGIQSKIESVKRALMTIDSGIEKPFVSLIGYSTPQIFEDTVDFNNATNGFIGRSLIVQELDTRPPVKKSFRSVPMPSHVQHMLKSLYLAGSFRACETERIEYYDDRIKIPTSAAAKVLLEEVSDAFESMAEDARASSGLEALAMRAYEQVAKVSLILAVAGGIRTEEHVLWAYAWVMRDIQQKTLWVTSSDKEMDTPQNALVAKILQLTSVENGELEGVIVNRLRKNRREDVIKCLAILVEQGLIYMSEFIHPTNKRIVRRYKRFDQINS